MAKPVRGAKAKATGATLAGLMARARKALAAVDAYEAAGDPDGDEARTACERFHREASALLDDVSPLLEIMAECRMLSGTYAPALYDLPDGEEIEDLSVATHLGFVAHAGRRSDATTFEIYAARLSSLSDPRPALILSGNDDDYAPFHPAVYARVPVAGHAVLAEAWHHDGDDVRVFHSRPILADPSNVEFVSQAFDVVGVQPARVPTFAVYGTLDPQVDLRDQSWDIEELCAEDVIALLGYDFEGSGIDWARRLTCAREQYAAQDDDGAGVYLRGEYRKLPKLDAPHPPGSERNRGDEGNEEQADG